LYHKEKQQVEFDVGDARISLVAPSEHCEYIMRMSADAEDQRHSTTRSQAIGQGAAMLAKGRFAHAPSGHSS
jgi:hypothetical protein